jgi:hypothetical protein
MNFQPIEAARHFDVLVLTGNLRSETKDAIL